MATQASILCPGKVTSQTLAGASGAEILVGNNAIIAVSGSAIGQIKFGDTGMGAAAATDFNIPANTIAYFDMGDHFSAVRIFGTGTYTVMQMNRS